MGGDQSGIRTAPGLLGRSASGPFFALSWPDAEPATINVATATKKAAWEIRKYFITSPSEHVKGVAEPPRPGDLRMRVAWMGLRDGSFAI